MMVMILKRSNMYSGGFEDALPRTMGRS